MCFTALTAFAKVTLQLVAVQNSFAHLLFPFHFFDMASSYTFFAIRDTFSQEYVPSWLERPPTPAP